MMAVALHRNHYTNNVAVMDVVMTIKSHDTALKRDLMYYYI
jgi:hypothetical protein